MKKLLITITLFISAFAIQAQKEESCGVASLETAEEIISAEPCVLIGANYIIARPIASKDAQYVAYQQLVIQWMSKTEYTFTLNAEMLKIMKDTDSELLGVYMSCLSKTVLENVKNPAEAGVKLFADYVADEKNKVKLNAGLKKLIKAKADGDVSKYI